VLTNESASGSASARGRGTDFEDSCIISATPPSLLAGTPPRRSSLVDGYAWGRRVASEDLVGEWLDTRADRSAIQRMRILF
jgi:hypothetical protein